MSLRVRLRRAWQPITFREGMIPIVLPKTPQRVAAQPTDPRIRLNFSPQLFVEIDRGLIPLQDHPLKASAAATVGLARQMVEKRFAVTPRPVTFLDEEIFEVETLPSEEGGEVFKKDGESDRLSIHAGK